MDPSGCGVKGFDRDLFRRGFWSPCISRKCLFTRVMAAAVICWSLNQPPEMRIFRSFLLDPRMPTTEGRLQSRWLQMSYVDCSTSLLRWGFFDSFLLDPRMPTTEGRCLQSLCLQMIGECSCPLSHCLAVLTKETERSGYNKGSELGFTLFNCMRIHIRAYVWFMVTYLAFWSHGVCLVVHQCHSFHPGLSFSLVPCWPWLSV